MSFHLNLLYLLPLIISFNESLDSPFLRCYYRCIPAEKEHGECDQQFTNFMTCTAFPTALNAEYAEGRLMFLQTFKCARIKYSANNVTKGCVVYVEDNYDFCEEVTKDYPSAKCSVCDTDFCNKDPLDEDDDD